MNLESIDFAALRIPGLALLVALSIGIGLVRYSAGAVETAEKRNKAQALQTQEARTKLHQSDQERNSILQYLPAYGQLQQIGFVGDEQRLNWVESLRTANLQTGLFGVQYEISARAPYSRAQTDNPLARQLYHSLMKISFGVVHEGDLLRFLNALSERRAGLYSLTGCSLERGALTNAPEGRRANLSAQCNLEWLTLDPKIKAQ